MKIIIEVLQDGMSAYTKDFNGITASAESFSELKESLKEVIQAQYEYLLEKGQFKEAQELKGAQIQYYLDLSQLFEVFKFINKSQFAEYIGINKSLFRQYTTKPTYISEERLKLINDGLHKAGSELLDIHLI